jgi:glycine/D-amino acid oxidase-like deaminating enzyme
LQPYTLTTTLFQILTDLYAAKLTIETHTPVLGVSYEGRRLSHRYTVTMNRGEVRANHVIYCTNGWTSHLLPNLAEKIFPWRTTMTCQEVDYNLLSGPQPVERPACAFREASGPVHDYANNLAVLGRDHITALGPTNRAYFNRLLIRSDALHYDTLIDDDDTRTPPNARDHVSAVLRNLITDEDLALQAHSRDQETWSGVCGYTADGIPISGKLSKEWTGRDGDAEWICAGCNGMGFTTCWGLGEMLAYRILRMDVELDRYGRNQKR